MELFRFKNVRLYTYTHTILIAIICNLVSRKIKYRQKNALIVQSVMRTVLAMRKYQPR